MTVKNMIQAINEAMDQAMAADERVIVLGEDVGLKGGVFRATEGLHERYGAQRVIDTPLAESSIVGAAIGASVNGLFPVAEIQFADYIHPAMNQIINEAARMHYRSNGAWNAPLVIRAPYGGGVHGALYHSQSVEAYFYHTPGLKIVTPSSAYDAKGLLLAAIHDPDPVLYLEHKRAYRLIKDEVPDEPYEVPIGPAEIRRSGRHVTVIAYGLMAQQCVAVAERLSRERGIEAEVIDLRTLAPIDRATIVASARRTGKVLIVHEDNKTGGVGAELSAIIAEEALFDLDAPIRRLTGPDVPAMPFAKTLEEWFLVNPERIAQAIVDLAEF